MVKIRASAVSPPRRPRRPLSPARNLRVPAGPPPVLAFPLIPQHDAQLRQFRAQVRRVLLVALGQCPRAGLEQRGAARGKAGGLLHPAPVLVLVRVTVLPPGESVREEGVTKVVGA